jgi:hypothetical protein
MPDSKDLTGLLDPRSGSVLKAKYGPLILRLALLIYQKKGLLGYFFLFFVIPHLDLGINGC